MNRHLLKWVAAVVFLVAIDSQAQEQFSDHHRKLGVGVSGEVAKVLVKAGDKVKAGDLLLELNLGAYQTALNAAGADVAYHTRALQEARADYARADELYQEGSLSTVELQNTELSLLGAESKLAAAVEKQAWARSKLGLARVVAPVDGTIVRRLVHPGERVIVGDHAPVQLILEPAAD